MTRYAIVVEDYERTVVSLDAHLRNRFSDSILLIEGNASGLRYLSAFFVRAAWKGGDVHVDPVREADPGWGVFDSGTQVVLVDRKYSGRARFESFNYEARAVVISGPRPLRPQSECETTNGSYFVLSGNLEALVSFAEHLLDLAEAGTRAGTEVLYRPGFELIANSVPFGFKRTS